MQKLLGFLFVLVLVFGIVGNVNAALINRGGGLIYDDVLDITWLQDANYANTSGYDSDGRMSWDAAVAWADQLVFGGYDDWRLASMDVNGDDTIVNCNGASESACRDNEYGYMYYQNLGGNLGDDLRGDQTVDDFTINNIHSVYWSGTLYPLFPNTAWLFGFGSGNQNGDVKDNNCYAWAVMDGDVAPVPIPSAIWLLGSALIGLVGVRKYRNK